jgi:hypothetical protein
MQRYSFKMSEKMLLVLTQGNLCDILCSVALAPLAAA